MQTSRTHITLYGKWRGALLSGLTVRDMRLVFAQTSKQPYGIFSSAGIVTASIDSNEQAFEWENLKIDADLPENSVLRVSCFASDSKIAVVGGNTTDLDAYLKAETGETPGDKLRMLEPLFSLAFSGTFDGLINARGRYLWLYLEILTPSPDEFCLRSLSLLYPSEKLMDYLPQIYRNHTENDNFFARYLNIFESIFFDIESRVDRLPEKLDFESTDGDMLRALAEWVCIDREKSSAMSVGELRQRISEAPRDYALIGTKTYVERFVEKELHTAPVIIEYFKVRGMIREGRDTAVYRELFGDNPYRFFILLPEEAFQGRTSLDAFTKELYDQIPAYTEPEIVLLRKRVVLDRHTYLGVNSFVGDYNSASVDRQISISYDTMIGGYDNEKQ